MKRIGFILVAIAAIVLGLLIGTLNSELVQLDLLWVQFELSLGLVILLGFSLGVITGMIILYLTRILPLRLQLRKARAASQTTQDPGIQDVPGISQTDD